MSDNCTLKDTVVATRLDSEPEVEIIGKLFNRDCENLDKSIPKKNNQYIDNCELPDIPEEPLILKKHITSPISVDGPIQKIPKNLLAALLPCCIDGRTPGPDIEIERELDVNSDKIEVDFTNAVLTKTIGIEEVGTLTLSLDVKSEECFCDTSCGDDDFVRIKLNAGIKFDEPEEPTDPDDPDNPTDPENPDDPGGSGSGGGGSTDPEDPDNPSNPDDPNNPSAYTDYFVPKSKIQEILNKFLTSCKPGFFAQVVEYNPLECISEYAEDTEFPEESVNYGNKWEYRIRRLDYDACETSCTKIEDVATHPITGESTETETLLAYNIIEYINTKEGMLGEGIRGYHAWHISYKVNPRQLPTEDYDISIQREYTLPVPVGTIIYVLSNEPDSCVSEDPDYEPVYLFSYENRNASAYPIIAYAKTVNRIYPYGATDGPDGTGERIDIGEVTLHHCDPTSNNEIQLNEMNFDETEIPNPSIPLSVMARNISNVSINGSAIAVMDSLGSYFLIPLPKVFSDGTGILKFQESQEDYTENEPGGTAEGGSDGSTEEGTPQEGAEEETTSEGTEGTGSENTSEEGPGEGAPARGIPGYLGKNKYDMVTGGNVLTTFTDDNGTSHEMYVFVSLPSTTCSSKFNNTTDHFYLPEGCHISFRTTESSVNVAMTLNGVPIHVPDPLVMECYFLPVLEGYAMCDINGVPSTEPTAYVNSSGEDVTGFTIQLKSGITFNGLNCIFASPTVVNEGNLIIAGTPVICQWDTTQGCWLITQAGCSPASNRNYNQYYSVPGHSFRSRDEYLQYLIQRLWEGR